MEKEKQGLPQPSAYVMEYEQLGLGLFIHWGLYSQLGRGEWVYDHENWSMEDYRKLQESFTAEDFDADKLVRMAKETGFRYITLTAKHHEGFALYDTCGINDFDAPHSPAKRDLVREFVDACNEHGIKPFLYYPTLDWYRKDLFEQDFDAYLAYINSHVELLCKNYGELGGLWFDGNWSKPDADWKMDELCALIRKYQPNAMIINNTGMDERGKVSHREVDAVTFENGQAEPLDRTGMEKYIAGEMCSTINDHWGIGFTDINYKSPREIIENLCHCRKVGANFLMNIGPEAQGAIHPYQRELLKLLGIWMGKFGEAIYNARPYPCINDEDAYLLKSINGDCLYLFALNIGTTGSVNVVLGGRRMGWYSFGKIKDRVKRITWMDSEEELDFVQKEEKLEVNLTGHPYGTSYGVRVAKLEL